MSKIREYKRKQLWMVGIVTLAVLAGLWFGLISRQQESLRRMADKKEQQRLKYDKMQTAFKNAAHLQAELDARNQRLASLEAGMASGDLYSWAINLVKEFKVAHKVEIPQFSQINGPAEMSLLPNFPYQQVSLSIAGTAHFYDLGKFIADFENSYPFIRLANVILEPVATAGEDQEKLSFKMDVIALVKPSTS